MTPMKSKTPRKAKLSFERLPRVRNRVALSKSEIYRRIRLGTFPKPITLGPKIVAWKSEDINQWIAERISESEAI